MLIHLYFHRILYVKMDVRMQPDVRWPNTRIHTYSHSYAHAGKVVEMKDQEVYVKDTFGLRSMDERGDLDRIAIPNIKHGAWLSDADNNIRYLFPHLDC